MNGPDLSGVPTCFLQWELDKREGIESRALVLGQGVEVRIDGDAWVERRGPLTVTVNRD